MTPIAAAGSTRGMPRRNVDNSKEKIGLLPVRVESGYSLKRLRRPRYRGAARCRDRAKFVALPRVTDAPLAERPLEAEYDGKSVDGCGKTSSSTKRNRGMSHEAMEIHR